MSEKLPGHEQREVLQAPVSYEEFLSTIDAIDHSSTEVPASKHHAFYQWLHENVPETRDIDGVSLLKLYETNVLEKDSPMSESEFVAYCQSIGMPYFGTPVYQMEYEDFLAQRDAAYEAWAEEHDIPVTSGSSMLFVDETGQVHRIYTETERRGKLVADPEYRPNGYTEEI